MTSLTVADTAADPLHSATRGPRPPAGPAIAAGLITVMLWASAFVVIRSVGRHFAPGPLALGRLLVGSSVLGLLVVVRGAPVRASFRRASRRDLGAVALCGVLWFGAYNVALNAGERRVDAGTAAMLVNVGPILIALIAGWILREGFPRNLLGGIAVAFAGAVIIGFATGARSSDAGTGALLCLLAAALYAGGVVAQKPALARHSALLVTLLACCAGAVVCLPYAPRLLSELGRAGAGAIAGMIYLGVFPTAIAFTTWAFALSRTTAGRMGSLTYLVPPLAVLAGWAFLGEVPPAAALLGGAVCLAGVALTRRR